MGEPAKPAATAAVGRRDLSYKFQRVREQLRAAIAGGTLSGKLPGERVLAGRFGASPKTLGKALTALAAEGLLDRGIGRGTYVRAAAGTAAPAGRSATMRWLVVCDADGSATERVGVVVGLIRAAHAATDVATDIRTLRPSRLNRIEAVIDLTTTGLPDDTVRDLVRRHVRVVAVGRPPQTYSTHAAVFDLRLAVTQVGHDLLRGGHRRLAVVEGEGGTAVADALRSTAARADSAATVDACEPADVVTRVLDGVTAFVCHPPDAGRQVREQLDRLGPVVPARVSVVAVGVTSGEPSVTGRYLSQAAEVEAIVGLLSGPGPYRPMTLWLPGHRIDRGTTGPVRAG